MIEAIRLYLTRLFFGFYNVVKEVARTRLARSFLSHLTLSVGLSLHAVRRRDSACETLVDLFPF